jgi:predicted AAA+ superfamily ATPase
MLYKRILEDTIKSNLFKNQIIVLYGPRQVGKTTLVRKIFDEFPGKKVFYQGDIPSERRIFEEPEPSRIKYEIGEAKLVIIDEAQLITNIGVTLKVIYDRLPDVQIIVTGSSSFDLANKIREPLTGRALEYMLYPLSYEEVRNMRGNVFMYQQFDKLMNYGWYPRVLELDNESSKQQLGLLQNNTLYKDIFALEDIKKPKILQDLVNFLAINIGSVVRIGSIAREIRTTEKTVERYIDILEKMFVIVKLPTFSRNANNELRNGYKIYFTDVGFRNSIINKFGDVELRMDKGLLFENFFILERIKFLNNHQKFKKKYFWQNYKQQEVDYIEEDNGRLAVFESKFETRKSKAINIFQDEYTGLVDSINIIHRDNYNLFLHSNA